MVGRPPSSHPKPARGRVAGTGLRAGAEGGPRPCCRAPSPALTTLVAAAPPVAAGLAAPPGLGAVAQLHPVSPLQGKEEFEKTQKELLEKGSITRQGKGQLELQQVRAPRLAASPGTVVLRVCFAS